MTTFKNVWLIDDDSISNFISSTVIKKSSSASEITQFTQVSKALSHLKELTQEDAEKFPDVIFLDIYMPVLNGWDFLNELANLPQPALQNCKVILLSHFPLLASDDEENLKNFRLEDSCIDKPLTTDKLTAIFN